MEPSGSRPLRKPGDMFFAWIGLPAVFKKNDREYPIDFQYPVLNSYYSKIIFRDADEVLFTPKNSSVQMNNKTSYTYASFKQSNYLTIRRVFKLGHSFYKRDEYKKLQEFFNKIVENENQEVMMNCKTSI